MLTLTAASDSTTVVRFGGNDGLDFTDATHREQIIHLLDTIRRLLLIGPSRGRLNSNWRVIGDSC